MPDHRDVAKTTGFRQRGSRFTSAPRFRQEVRRTGFRLEGALSSTSTPLRGQEGSGNRVPFVLLRFGAVLLTPRRRPVKRRPERSFLRASCERGAASNPAAAARQERPGNRAPVLLLARGAASTPSLTSSSSGSGPGCAAVRFHPRGGASSCEAPPSSSGTGQLEALPVPRSEGRCF